MTTAPDTLPTDADALRALLLAERAHHAAEMAQVRAAADEEIARLRQMILALQRHRFGRRAERLDPDQMALALEDLEQTLADRETAPQPAGARGGRPVRRKVNRGNGINPQAWFTDVLTRLAAGHPVNRLDELLPWAYANSPKPAVA